MTNPILQVQEDAGHHVTIVGQRNDTFFCLSPLGIDYDFGHSLRLVVDPVEFALPIPLVGQLPLYYEQFRFMVGLQIGS